MTTKLELYNLALGTYVGTQALARLDENVASRYALDRVFDRTIGYMLELGIWKFALRTVAFAPDPIKPLHHRAHRFLIPADFVRLCKISSEKTLRTELLDFVEESGYWLSDTNQIYSQFVSKLPSHGLNLAIYPETYIDAVASRLAYASLLPINKDRGDRADLLKLHKETLATARRIDAVDEAIKRKPPGNWPAARGRSTGYIGTSR